MNQTVERDSHHVGHRHKQQGEGHQKGFRTGGPDVWVVGSTFNGQESQNESQRQRARVAHEYLCVALSIAKQVEIAEGNQRTYQSCHQNRVSVYKHLIMYEVGQEPKQRQQ